jgi:hypothetical protein
MKRISRTALLSLFVLLAGCGSSEFNKDTAKEVIEANPVQLNGEQLLLTEEQVTCGNQQDLWHLTQLGSKKAIGHLTDKGRALQFTDDVRVGEQGAAGATVQVTGKFALRALQVPSLQNEGERSRVVEAKTVVVVNHECFKGSSPALLGVRRGEFTASANPMFRLKLRDDWSVSELIH